jgi:hypothetical protein
VGLGRVRRLRARPLDDIVSEDDRRRETLQSLQENFCENRF